MGARGAIARSYERSRFAPLRVAVVGAGPAGAIAACELARAGAEVVLYERSAWPRRKACGDGLTPTSVALLEDLGIPIPGRRPLQRTRVSGPRERAFTAPWPRAMPDGTTCPRVDFDATLVRAAIAGGATFEDRTDVLACADARLRIRRLPRGSETRRTFDVVVLAEGGVGKLAASCGLPPHDLRLVAYRGYVATQTDLEAAYQIHYAREFVPGYAWIFPVDRRLANVGAVLVERGDVRARLNAWLARSAIARVELGNGAHLEDGRGGIVPIGRGRRVASRVFAVGDAAGVADPLSAEGVSQAMETGRMVARALEHSRGDTARAGIAYERDLRTFDINNREALRMRALFGILADPFVEIAWRRPRFARHVIASGYFRKHDAAWIARTLAALR